MCKEWSVCFRERKKMRMREECLLEEEEEKCSMDDRMKDKCLVEREESGGVLNGLLVV